jgi:hypothetical protein
VQTIINLKTLYVIGFFKIRVKKMIMEALISINIKLQVSMPTAFTKKSWESLRLIIGNPNQYFQAALFLNHK